MRALVVGGSGAVGSTVARALRAAGDDVAITWRSRRSDVRGWPCDLTERDAIPALFAAMDAEAWTPDALVWAAGVPASEVTPPEEPAALDRAMRVHVGAALEAIRELDRRPAAGVRNVVLVGALAPGQSFAVAPHFGAVQGAMGSLAMALGHALGPRGMRVNVVALGLLDTGAAGAVTPESRASYERFAALRRVGTAEEAARTIAWLARENRVINGRVIPANGGI